MDKKQHRKSRGGGSCNPNSFSHLAGALKKALAGTFSGPQKPTTVKTSASLTSNDSKPQMPINVYCGHRLECPTCGYVYSDNRPNVAFPTLCPNDNTTLVTKGTCVDCDLATEGKMTQSPAARTLTKEMIDDIRSAPRVEYKPCCYCGYNGEEETPCTKIGSGVHCQCWYDKLVIDSPLHGEFQTVTKVESLSDKISTPTKPARIMMIGNPGRSFLFSNALLKYAQDKKDLFEVFPTDEANWIKDAVSTHQAYGRYLDQQQLEKVLRLRAGGLSIAEIAVRLALEPIDVQEMLDNVKENKMSQHAMDYHTSFYERPRRKRLDLTKDEITAIVIDCESGNWSANDLVKHYHLFGDHVVGQIRIDAGLKSRPPSSRKEKQRVDINAELEAAKQRVADLEAKKAEQEIAFDWGPDESIVIIHGVTPRFRAANGFVKFREWVERELPQEGSYRPQGELKVVPTSEEKLEIQNALEQINEYLTTSHKNLDRALFNLLQPRTVVIGHHKILRLQANPNGFEEPGVRVLPGDDLNDLLAHVADAGSRKGADNVRDAVRILLENVPGQALNSCIFSEPELAKQINELRSRAMSTSKELEIQSAVLSTTTKALDDARAQGEGNVRTAVRILLENKPGAALNACTEDERGLANMIGDLRRSYSTVWVVRNGDETLHGLFSNEEEAKKYLNTYNSNPSNRFVQLSSAPMPWSVSDKAQD